jgi:hypothetical protein
MIRSHSIAPESRGTLLAVFLMALVLLAGCGHRNAPVNVDVAEDTLKTVLEKWQAGEKLEDLQDETPQIVVQDLDWSGGAKLTSFEILSDAQPMDANLYAKVKLKLRNKGDEDVEKTVTYCVGTSPVLTVFRDMMH